MSTDKKRKYTNRVAYTCRACKSRKKKCGRGDQKNEADNCSFCESRGLICSLAANEAKPVNVSSQLQDLQSLMQSLTNLLVDYKRNNISAKTSVETPSVNANIGSFSSPSSAGTHASPYPLREYYGKASIASILSPFAGDSSSKQNSLTALPRSAGTPRLLPKITANETIHMTVLKQLITYFFTHYERSFFIDEQVTLSYIEQQSIESLDDGQYGLLLTILASAAWTLDSHNDVFSLSQLSRIELCYLFSNQFQNLQLTAHTLESAQAFTLWALLCLMMERSSDA